MGIDVCYLLQNLSPTEIITYLSQEQINNCAQSESFKKPESSALSFYNHDPGSITSSTPNTTANSQEHVALPEPETTALNLDPSTSRDSVASKLFEQAAKLKAQLETPPRELNIKIDKNQYLLWTRPHILSYLQILIALSESNPTYKNVLNNAKIAAVLEEVLEEFDRHNRV